MTDLSKIDFSKCELPRWRGKVLRVDRVIEGIHIDTSDRFGTVHVAVKVLPGFHHPNENQWIAQHPATFTELDDLSDICAKVDAFIESELKRIEEEKLPPWRDCTLDEAMANPECSEACVKMNRCATDTLEQWTTYHKKRIERCIGMSADKYKCRTRAPKPEPKKETVRDAGIHCPRCGSTKMKSWNVETDSGIEIVQCAPWVTSNGVTAVQSKPIVTTANCKCTCGSSFESREEHWPNDKLPFRMTAGQAVDWMASNVGECLEDDVNGALWRIPCLHGEIEAMVGDLVMTNQLLPVMYSRRFRVHGNVSK